MFNSFTSLKRCCFSIFLISFPARRPESHRNTPPHSIPPLWYCGKAQSKLYYQEIYWQRLMRLICRGINAPRRRCLSNTRRSRAQGSSNQGSFLIWFSMTSFLQPSQLIFPGPHTCANRWWHRSRTLWHQGGSQLTRPSNISVTYCTSIIYTWKVIRQIKLRRRRESQGEFWIHCSPTEGEKSVEGGEIRNMGCIISANEVDQQDKKPFLSLVERRAEAQAERKVAKSLVRNLVHEEFGRWEDEAQAYILPMLWLLAWQYSQRPVLNSWFSRASSCVSSRFPLYGSEAWFKANICMRHIGSSTGSNFCLFDHQQRHVLLAVDALAHLCILAPLVYLHQDSLHILSSIILKWSTYTEQQYTAVSYMFYRRYCFQTCGICVIK